MIIWNSTRILAGVADAASMNSIASILMVMYPSNVATVMSWTRMLFGFGYMIGKNANARNNKITASSLHHYIQYKEIQNIAIL